MKNHLTLWCNLVVNILANQMKETILENGSCLKELFPHVTVVLSNSKMS